MIKIMKIIWSIFWIRFINEMNKHRHFSSVNLWRLSITVFLNTQNDRSTSTDVGGAYLKQHTRIIDCTFSLEKS